MSFEIDGCSVVHSLKRINLFDVIYPRTVINFSDIISFSCDFIGIPQFVTKNHTYLMYRGEPQEKIIMILYNKWINEKHETEIEKMQKEISELKQTVEELKNIFLYAPPNNGGSEFQKAKAHFASI